MDPDWGFGQFDPTGSSTGHSRRQQKTAMAHVNFVEDDTQNVWPRRFAESCAPGSRRRARSIRSRPRRRRHPPRWRESSHRLQAARAENQSPRTYSACATPGEHRLHIAAEESSCAGLGGVGQATSSAESVGTSGENLRKSRTPQCHARRSGKWRAPFHSPASRLCQCSDGVGPHR